MKRWAGLHDFNYREPCPIFSVAPGGVSGQPGNNGSYAPALYCTPASFASAAWDHGHCTLTQAQSCHLPMQFRVTHLVTSYLYDDGFLSACTSRLYMVSLHSPGYVTVDHNRTGQSFHKTQIDHFIAQSFKSDCNISSFQEASCHMMW